MILTSNFIKFRYLILKWPLFTCRLLFSVVLFGISTKDYWVCASTWLLISSLLELFKFLWEWCPHFYFYGILLANVTVRMWRHFHCIYVCILNIPIYQNITQNYQFFSATSVPKRCQPLTYMIKCPENRNLSGFLFFWLIQFISCLLPHFFWVLRSGSVLCLPSLCIIAWELGYVTAWVFPTSGPSVMPALVFFMHVLWWLRSLCMESAIPTCDLIVQFSVFLTSLTDGHLLNESIICTDCLTWHNLPLPRK